MAGSNGERRAAARATQRAMLGTHRTPRERERKSGRRRRWRFTTTTRTHEGGERGAPRRIYHEETVGIERYINHPVEAEPSHQNIYFFTGRFGALPANDRCVLIHSCVIVTPIRFALASLTVTQIKTVELIDRALSLEIRHEHESLYAGQ